ncbi:3-hydroxyacyl-CoA dehydrogenase [Bacillus dakarensis]|uniref:3-hydroxyacyl-CoA dehydrogenase n=1 Tax=Robertmurraya dakarensis TaxID=1926278 RepID=UPI000980C74A|nr:3-hydroxyacyl-CoA dehydrogenase [Bacillus dakarensis]
MRVGNIKDVAVIGAGDMGHGIAETALLGGLNVYLTDTTEENLQRGVANIEKSLVRMLSGGKISDETVAMAKKNLHPTLDFEEAVTKAQFVFEAVPEVLEIKQKLFQKLEELTSKETILATNTSSMLISQISQFLHHKERVVGLHFFNPVVVIPLVEVIKGKDTSSEVMQTAYDLCVKMHKTPVRVEKDSPSFIINRVNGPSRIYLGAVVDKGVAQPEEIDALIRYHGKPIGNFELCDHIGLDVIHDASEYRKGVLHPDYEPYEKLKEKVRLKEYGKKTGKGFYDWSNGRPTIDLSKRTDKVKIEDMDFIKFNEAVKLLEEGVSNVHDIDLAFRLTGDEKGPFEAVQNFELKEIVQRLEFLSDRYGKEILKPAKMLSEYYDDEQWLVGIGK